MTLSSAVPMLRRTVKAMAGADAGSRSIAQRALGHALLIGGRVDEATHSLRVAVRLARRSGERDVLGAALLKLAHARLLGGALDDALRLATDALGAGDPDSSETIRAYGTRALILREKGGFRPALADLDRAVAGLRRLGDDLGLQRALLNRATVQIDILAVEQAIADLAEAERLARQLHRPAALGLIVANRGYAAAKLGEVPEALAHYARAEQVFRENGAQVAGILMDQSELLWWVGLTDEARIAAEAALHESRRERRSLRIPETRLLLARTAAASGDLPLARDQARRARATFRRQGRATWASAAGLEVARADRLLARPPRWRALSSAGGGELVGACRRGVSDDRHRGA